MKVRLAIATLAVLVLIAVTGCKKDAPVKNFVVTKISDTSGVNTSTITYDASGKVVKLFGGSMSYDMYYSGDKIVRRTYTQSGTMQEIDSFFYDGASRIFKVVKYDALTATKAKTTVFTYNGQNQVTDATVDNESAIIDDELFEFTYSDGKLSERKKSLKQGGVYKLSSKLEFLAYDNVKNPLSTLYRTALMDIIEAFVYFSAYPNNLTQGKQTLYDTVTGNVTGVTPITLSLTYNSDGYPIRLDLTEGANSGVLTLEYTEL